ncbi:MAG TPA: hypothetical protein VGQ41_23455 [Pyrinomonadaceae bacterium]|jgi:hypothetical protein|nr:hypothetical protein [Pyrinomonadaceae bacterium]
MLGAPNDSTILRLRVKGSDLDPFALRGRVESLLNDLSLQPRLPPSATLFIRKLNDPLPGSLCLDTSYPRAPQAWRHAFITKFDQLVSSAARPAHGYVADSAESVVFYDYAELLASLSADWCSGSVNTRWWWQGFIKRGDVAQVIKQLWRDKIEYAPAALEHLVRKNVVVEFVSKFSEVEAHEMVQHVVRVFGLHAVTQIKRIQATDLPRSVLALVDFTVEQEDAVEVRSVMPWKNVVPESDTPRLRPAQQLFVGIALMVHRAPARVRTLSFAREVERWVERAIKVSVVPEMVVEERIENEFFEPSETPAPFSVNQAVAPSALVAPEPSRQQRSVSSEAKLGNAIFKYEERPVIAPVAQTVNGAEVANPEPLIKSELLFEPAPPAPFATPTESLDTITIETELGGLFYLINLGIFLEIYSDFTSPVERFTELSIWDFVAIVGAQLLNDEANQDDPVWCVLENLAEPDKSECPSWLLDLLPYIKTRLPQALGINDDVDLGEMLLHHHAKVVITPTHLDIFFALATHPIEIRFAGLDRDPGWVPAAGRFIAFHYD